MRFAYTAHNVWLAFPHWGMTSINTVPSPTPQSNWAGWALFQTLHCSIQRLTSWLFFLRSLSLPSLLALLQLSLCFRSGLIRCCPVKSQSSIIFRYHRNFTNFLEDPSLSRDCLIAEFIPISTTHYSTFNCDIILP